MAKKKLLLALVTGLLISTLSGCSLADSLVEHAAEEISESISESFGISSEEMEALTVDKLDKRTARVDESTEENEEEETETANGTYSIPACSGAAYVSVNGGEPMFTEEEITTDVFETYSEQDSLGRCGVAYANICKELMPTEVRGEIGSVKPSGWHTVKYNGYVEGNYLYNRCHLIGYQLAGENANEKNLITGTRYMNVDGMLPFENKIAGYIDANPNNHVLYRVTPVFTGDNLVADGVLMEAYSVEDAGAGVSFCVFCYNIQPGITIDYSTGESELDADYTGEYAITSSFSDASGSGSGYTAAGQGGEKNISEETTYVINTNSGKFHDPGCDSVTDMASKNLKETTKDRDVLVAEGYSPCGRCNP